VALCSLAGLVLLRAPALTPAALSFRAPVRTTRHVLSREAGAELRASSTELAAGGSLRPAEPVPASSQPSSLGWPTVKMRGATVGGKHRIVRRWEARTMGLVLVEPQVGR